jgi:aryl-alcohol dehydrogenase-like predicted oxidoreductase
VDRRRIGKTEIEISPIGLGCWQFSQGKGFAGKFWSNLDQGTIDAVVETALRGGINWFDTAEMYGGGQSETALSTALRKLAVKPGSVVIATKWSPFFRTAGNIARTISTRLNRLAGYPIDLHQIHHPASLSPISAQMRQMGHLQRAGHIRSIGVSNFSARQMEAAAEALRPLKIPLASNQVRISLLDRSVERNGVLDAARRLGVTLIAYSPLAQGLLTGRVHEDPALAAAIPAARKSIFSAAGPGGYTPAGLARTRPLVNGLREVAHAHGVTPAQVALAWLIGYYGETVVAIPGCTRTTQAEQCAAAMDLRLTPKEMERIDELSKVVTAR